MIKNAFPVFLHIMFHKHFMSCTLFCLGFLSATVNIVMLKESMDFAPLNGQIQSYFLWQGKAVSIQYTLWITGIQKLI